MKSLSLILWAVLMLVSPGLAKELPQVGETLLAGSILSVDLQVLLPKGYHLYGPSATGVVPVSLKFAPHPFCEVLEVNYPPAPAIPVLDEVVPAYQGTVTFRARIQLKYDKASRESLALLDQTPLHTAQPVFQNPY